MKKTAAQILGLHICKTTISVSAPKAKKGDEDFPFEEFLEKLPEMLEPDDEQEEKENDKEASCKDHQKPAYSVKTRDGSSVVCPHCGGSLQDKDIYTDKKGWKFCRVCFRKGRGAMRVEEKSAAATPFAFEYELPPDPEIFDMEKVAQGRSRVGDSRGYKPKDARPEVQNVIAGQAGAPYTEPWFQGIGKVLPYAMPAAGAAAGYALSDEEDEANKEVGNNILKGLATGGGGMLGALAGSKLGGGDIGSAITGTAAGGALAYLLSRAALG